MMSLQIHVNAKATTTPLIPYWSTCVGAGRAHEGLRAQWLEQLDFAVEHCNFRYLRFHGLFHDEMCVYREQNGQPIYNWQYLDELFDRLLDLGIRPFVELGFFPKAIAAENSKTQFWWKGYITPPENFEKWGELVKQFVLHCRHRYGAEEVRKWYFEVWNEPNLAHAFWDGTRSQYFEMYRVTAQTIKAIDPELRVGGPATSNFVPDARFDGDKEDTSKQTTAEMKDLGQGTWRAPWVEAFMEFCAQEKLPIDFIATHPYPTDFPIDSGGDYVGRTRPATATRDDLQWLRKIVDASPFPQAEIHLTEWSSSPSPRDHAHDSLPAATFVVRALLESIGLVDSLSYWVFTDVFEESGGGDTIFHGGFGLINFQGIVKPTFHAYRFLNLLGDELIEQGEGYLASCDFETHKISLLAYHYPPELREAPPLATTPEQAEAILKTGQPRALKIVLENLPPKAAFVLETLDATHGFALPAWKEIGSPQPPTREETKLLQEAAWNLQRDHLHADASGKLVVERTLTPWAIVSLREV